MDRPWKGPWGLKKSIGVLAIAGLLVATLSIFMGMDQRRSFGIDQSSFCQFPAVYNFGDSNSDTGSISATYGPVAVPNGVTFFGKPSGRYSDGRLVIDFIAKKQVLYNPFSQFLNFSCRKLIINNGLFML